MTPIKQRYKKEYAKELLKVAEGDLESATVLSNSKSGRIENVIYLAQQAVEKAIKSVLIALEREVVHTHDIDVLIVLLPESVRPPKADRLGALSQFAAVRRYEQGREIITPADIKATLKLAAEILDWGKSKI